MGSLFQGIQSTVVWCHYSQACIKAEDCVRDPVVSKAAVWWLRMKEHRCDWNLHIFSKSTPQWTHFTQLDPLIEVFHLSLSPHTVDQAVSRLGNIWGWNPNDLQFSQYRPRIPLKHAPSVVTRDQPSFTITKKLSLPPYPAHLLSYQQLSQMSHQGFCHKRQFRSRKVFC